MVYNNPATSGIDLSPVDCSDGEGDNLTMVKESSGDIQRMHVFMSFLGYHPLL